MTSPNERLHRRTPGGSFAVSTRLLWIFAIQLLVLLALFSVTLGISMVRSRAQIDNSIHQLNQTLISDTQAKLSQLDTATKFPHLRSYSSAFGQLFSSLLQKEPNRGRVMQSFMEESNLMFNQFPKLESMVLFTPQGESISARTTTLADISVAEIRNSGQMDWFVETLGSSGGACYFGGELGSQLGYNGSPNVVYGSRAILNSYNGLSPMAVLLTSVNITDLYASFNRQRLFEKQRFVVLDSGGRYLMGDRTLADGQLPLRQESRYLAQQGDYTCHISYSVSSQVYAVIATPRAVLERASSLSSTGAYLVMLLVILTTMGIFAMVIRSITGPIRSMVTACDKIETGDFGFRIEKQRHDEMGYLIDSFNGMLDRVDNLINEVYLKDITERNLELQMLRSQINPHFLYNTLESMRMAAIVQGAPELGEMCRLLAKVLRYGVSQPNEMVTVGEEIERLEDYIQLQSYRFHDKVRIVVCVDSQLYQCRIIKLVLQPILENALNHGVDIESGQGVIQVMGYQNGDSLLLTVSDNGVGMDSQTVESLTGYLHGRNDSFSSIGLKNIHRRIQLVYGEAYGIAITSQLNRGTQVQVTLPMRPQQGRDEDVSGSDCG